MAFSDFSKSFLIKSQDNLRELDISIRDTLKRYRSITLGYKTNSYLFAVYKSLVYYKYAISSGCYNKDELSDKILSARIFCEELIANYNWDNKQYFFSILKDIADFCRLSDSPYDNLISYMPQSYKDLFIELLNNKTNYLFFSEHLQGIFSDNDNKVNLLHYSYHW